MTGQNIDIESIPDDRPVLIAGPTASGKSALALEIATTRGGVIVNADALQVWSCWRILSARPSAAEEAQAPHRLYGHLAPGADWSVGHWLRAVQPLLAGPERPILVGGTGLFFTALTEGLAEIPATPPEVRSEAARIEAAQGIGTLLAGLDAATAARIDQRNPARIRRAWEVLRATGRGLADWQAETGRPVLPLSKAAAVVVEADRDALATRIDARFEAMMGSGALEEVRAVLPIWEGSAPWAKAIGAPELVAHLRGDLGLPEAMERAKAASRQYAKRQRSWMRNRLGTWPRLPAQF